MHFNGFFLQAVMDLNLTSAPLAAHITALHRLTKDGAAGGGGSVGAPKQWCPRVYATCNEALGRIVDARGQAVSQPCTFARILISPRRVAFVGFTT